MIVDESGAPITMGGFALPHPGHIADTFERNNNLALGNGWTDLSSLFPDDYDPTGIYEGSASDRDPFWLSKRGFKMNSGYWDDYADTYPARRIGGIGGAIRDVGSDSYDVTVTSAGLLGGADSTGSIHNEASPLVGVNTESADLAYGAWLSRIADTFVWLVGRIGIPGEEPVITHTLSDEDHTDGTPFEVTIKYRSTEFTIWKDGTQVTGFVDQADPEGPTVDTIPVDADYQASTWAGFAFDQHLTTPRKLIGRTPAVTSYKHQVVA